MDRILPPNLDGMPREAPPAPPMLEPLSKIDAPPFMHFKGTLSGRVENSDGTVSFVLGDLSTLRKEDFEIGDYFEVWQEVDVGDIDKIETFATTPSFRSSTGWALQLRIGSVIFAEKDLPERIKPSRVHLVAPISIELGVKRVSVRLLRR